MRPLRAAIWLALGFAALGLLFVIYSIVSFFFVQHTVAGWTSIMAAIAILGAAQLFVLGIVGEYVGRILRETRRRPSYVVAETEADRQQRTPVSELRIRLAAAAARSPDQRRNPASGLPHVYAHALDCPAISSRAIPAAMSAIAC